LSEAQPVKSAAALAPGSEVALEKGETITMKKFNSLLFGMFLLLSAATSAFAQDEKKDDNKEQKTKKRENQPMEAIMSSEEKNVEVMLRIFSAIERRDAQRALELFQPDIEFQWPPSLPYGGTSRGLKLNSPTWVETWDPLQPTEAERRMDPRVVAASEEEVVILWRQRGVSPAGNRIDTPVLGLYQLREGKLARAQMFYFDTAATLSFLAKVKGQ
jgi:uncharacterized protein